MPMKNLPVTGLWIGLFLAFAGLRNAQSKPKKPESLNFTEVWVWEYRDPDGNNREMAIYHHPKKSYWLFTPEAYGPGDEMTEWIMIKPDGECIQRYSDENGQQKTLYHTLHFNLPGQLPSRYRATGASKLFGDRSHGFPGFKGKAYEAKFEKTTDQALYYLAETKRSMAPVYYFNRLNTEVKLPVIFPADLPRNQVVLEEEAQAGGKKIRYRFKFISHTEYHISLSQIP